MAAIRACGAARATALITAVLLAAACGGPSAGRAASGAGPRRSAPPAATGAGPAANPRPRAAPSPIPSPSPAVTVIPVPPPPAGLHQTATLPSPRSRAFRAEMTDLWAAVITGKTRLAAQAFFPLAAYTQVKAIGDPAGDWRTRLFAEFRLDVGAAHHLVGGRASLLRVIVPSAQAAWVGPGVCENAVGYWHVAGARMLYSKHGRLRSIGIASLISWRGRWYVIHFGAEERPGPGGFVDAPANGPGIPGPPGGC